MATEDDWPTPISEMALKVATFAEECKPSLSQFMQVFLVRRCEVESSSSTLMGENSQAFNDISIPSVLCSKSVPTAHVGEREIATGFPE